MAAWRGDQQPDPGQLLRFSGAAFTAFLRAERTLAGLPMSWREVLPLHGGMGSSTLRIPSTCPGLEACVEAGLIRRGPAGTDFWYLEPPLRLLGQAMQVIPEGPVENFERGKAVEYFHRMFTLQGLHAVTGQGIGDTTDGQWERGVAILADPAHVRRVLHLDQPPGLATPLPDPKTWLEARRLLRRLLAAKIWKAHAPAPLARLLRGVGPEPGTTAPKDGEPVGETVGETAGETVGETVGETAGRPGGEPAVAWHEPSGRRLADILYLALSTGLLLVVRGERGLEFAVSPVLHRRWRNRVLHGDAGWPDPPAVKAVPPPAGGARSGAYLLWDLEMFLVAAANGEIGVKSIGQALLARTIDRLADRLNSLDGPVVWPQTRSVAMRLQHVEALAREKGLVTLATEGKRKRLVPTPAGANWLASSPGVRWRFLVNLVFGGIFRPDAPWPTPEPGRAQPFYLSLCQAESQLLRPDNRGLVAPALRECFTYLGEGEFGRATDVVWHRADLCPGGADLRRDGGAATLPPAGQPGSRLPPTYRPPFCLRPFRPFWTWPDLAEAWANQVAHLLETGLSPLGGIAWGEGPDGWTVFTLTPVGRFILGLQADFPEVAVDGGGGAGVEGGRGTGAVLVQGNFEIVFRRPEPRLEAALAPFAERTGQRVGTVFRLTRASVMAALAGGHRLAALWSHLDTQSAAPVPDNVRTEIEAWGRQVVTAVARPAVVLVLPDEAALRRALAAGRGKVVHLGGLTVELPAAPAAHRPVLARLQEAGVFVTLPDTPAPTPTRRTRRPRRWP